MSFWNNLKEKAAGMTASLQTNVAKFKNAEFANGSMAMCALIAAADGSVSGSEKTKIASLIMNNEVLKVFPASELKDKFDFFCNKLTADFDFGKIEAIQAVAKLKSKPDQARAVVQIGIIIGSSDGNFDADEKKVVKEVCLAVGIPPSDFDLQPIHCCMEKGFTRGQKAKLTDRSPNQTEGSECIVEIDLTAPGGEVDFGCFGLDKSGRLVDERYFVFYNQKESPCGGVKLQGNSTYRLQLDRLPATIDRIVLTATIDGTPIMQLITKNATSAILLKPQAARR